MEFGKLLRLEQQKRAARELMNRQVADTLDAQIAEKKRLAELKKQEDLDYLAEIEASERMHEEKMQARDQARRAKECSTRDAVVLQIRAKYGPSGQDDYSPSLEPSPPQGKKDSER